MQQCHGVRIYGAIEAGGTKFVCGVGTGPDDLRTIHFPTEGPKATIARAVEFLEGRGLAAVGVGSFGPVELDRNSPQYGHITSTPKHGWQNIDLAGELSRALRVPIAFTTDVNGAAFGEYTWGAGRGLASSLYLTIGTGIGGGIILNGVPLQGAMHPEVGHLRIPRDPADHFPGICPYHGDCLEGLASGPALAARWGKPGSELPPEHEAWRMEARYLALGIANIVFTVAPARVILGGGVMHQTQLFAAIRSEFATILNGYLRMTQIVDRLDEYIVPPQLGDRAGVLGALALAMAGL